MASAAPVKVFFIEPLLAQRNMRSAYDPQALPSPEAPASRGQTRTCDVREMAEYRPFHGYDLSRFLS
jgi:hypothetical protein